MPSNPTKLNQIYLVYLYKEDLALNNLQGLICHKTKLNHIYLIYLYKEDSALNNTHALICHKTWPKPSCVDILLKFIFFFFYFFFFPLAVPFVCLFSFFFWFSQMNDYNSCLSLYYTKGSSTFTRIHPGKQLYFVFLKPLLEGSRNLRTTRVTKLAPSLPSRVDADARAMTNAHARTYAPTQTQARAHARTHAKESHMEAFFYC